MDPTFRVWWCALVILACCNVCMLLNVLASPAVDSYESTMRTLGVPYVFQTTWRSVLPSEYVYRKTATDLRINSVLIARLLAVVGEFCYGVQIALVLHALTPAPGAVAACSSAAIVMCDGVGQLCATYGTVMQNQYAFFLEGLLWSTIFTFCLARGCYLLLSVTFGHAEQTFIGTLVLGMCAALPYMLLDYCPMCLRAWRRDVEQASKRGAKPRLSLRKGAWAALTVRAPTQRWADWREEWMWQTLYFSVGSWFCMWLMTGPRFRG